MATEPTDINSNEQAAHRRRLLGTVNSLRSMGFSKDLTLPQMICVGSQSVGKSSLIEALARINLPRESGTCTRCPIECRLKHTPGGAWKARVLLRFEPSEIKREEGEVVFGDIIMDQVDLQDRISRAQKAVLQPEVSSDRFLKEDVPPTNSSFTKSCVVVELSGDELTDLTFIDLPGLIANSSDALTENDIQLVEDLVSSYMSDPSSLILLVVACESDFETHRSVFLARKHDPSGARTIGVLTKPDRIEQDEEGRWIEMVAGRSNVLKNGWFVVKQPTGRELRSKSYTWERARDKERDFFETHAIWAPITQQFPKQFGTIPLAHQLGEKLSEAIKNMLPSIRKEIDRLIRENEATLEKLPKPITESARSMLRNLLDEFLDKVNKKLIRGDALARERGLFQQMHQKYHQMRIELQGAALVYRPDDPTTELPRPSFLPEDEPWISRSESNQMTLSEVAKDAQLARTREYPDDVPFELKKDYMSKVVKSWRQPAKSAFIVISEIFYDILMEIIKEDFSIYHDGQLDVIVRDISTLVVDRCKKETSKQLDSLLEQEGEPYTAHVEQYRTYKQQFLQYYRSVCYPRTMLDSLQAAAEGIIKNNPIASAAESLAQGMLYNTNPIASAAESLAQGILHNTNSNGSGASRTLSYPQESAIDLMASTRAHYQIAYRRFSDNVPMTVDQYFIRGFWRNIRNALHNGLHPVEGDSESYYEDLLKESNTDAELRQELLARQETLYAARREVA